MWDTTHNDCDCAVRMQVLFEEDPNAVAIVSDEAYFHWNGSANKQNLRYWALENPRNIREKPLHSDRVPLPV